MNSTTQPIFSIEDLYKQYWRCRDFELTNLWQRSVFLTAFMGLFLTGYAVYFSKLFINGNEHTFINLFPTINTTLAHLIGLLFSVIGIIFSILWILMAKASKSWYEVYERAITAIDISYYNYRSFMPINRIGGFHFERLPLYHNKSMTDPDQKIDDAFDSMLFSTNGGLFSPSKINIAIGHVLFLVWISILTLHFSCLMAIYYDFYLAFVFVVFDISLFLIIVSFKQFKTIVRFIICPLINAPSKQSLFHWWIGSNALKRKDPGKPI